MNIHLLDGVNNTNYIGNMYVIPPIIDAIEEFKVQSHNDKAEFGGVLGGIINVISKTGTNEFHGSLWEFVRNDVLNARDPVRGRVQCQACSVPAEPFGAAVGDRSSGTGPSSISPTRAGASATPGQTATTSRPTRS